MTPARSRARGYRRSGTRPTGSALATTAAACHATGRSGNINTNNNRRQVGPLQAIAPGPVQAIVFTELLARSLRDAFRPMRHRA